MTRSDYNEEVHFVLYSRRGKQEAKLFIIAALRSFKKV
jgi:hypothetical protein